MRSGPSSPRRRRTATPTTRPTTARGTTGTTSRSTPSTGWSSCVVPGERTAENIEAVVGTSSAGPAGRLMDLITTDDYPAYEGRSWTPTARRSRRPGPASGAGPEGPYKVAAGRA